MNVIVCKEKIHNGEINVSQNSIRVVTKDDNGYP